MGDTGAYLIGLMLAYAPIASTADLNPAELTTVNRYPTILPLLLPAAIFVIPCADLLLAVVRRTKQGRSVFAPDRKHLHHRLLDIGHSHRLSVLIMYLWAALFSFGVVALSVVRTPLLVLSFATVGAVIVLLLMSMPRLRGRWNGRSPDDATGRPAPLAVPGDPRPAPGDPNPVYADSGQTPAGKGLTKSL
jgi:UDP-GlcNAc:undecaprenyl-phosphate GlcNAc-1-phosphate transferase